jgi:hypothetical protein
MTGPGQLLITATGRLSSFGQYYQSFNRSISRRIVNYGNIDISVAPFMVSALMLSSEIVNRGTMQLSGHADIAVQTVSAPGYITNFGTMQVLGSLVLRGANGGIRLNNQGTVRAYTNVVLTLNGGAYGGGSWIADTGSEIIFGGLGSNLSGASMPGEGRIRVACAAAWADTTIAGTGDMVVGTAGKLTLNGAATITRSTLTNLGVITIGSGATINGNYVSTGQTNLGLASLTVNGNLTLGGASQLRLNVPPVPSIVTRIRISGHANLAGGLTAAYLFSPDAGSHFTFLKSGTHSGTFDFVQGTGLSPGKIALFDFVGEFGRLTVATL